MTGTGVVALRPACHSCGRFLELRPATRQTPEQKWCGVWYDHPTGEIGTFGVGHTTSVLYESPALKAQLAEQRKELATV